MTRTNFYGELRRGDHKIMSTRGLDRAIKKAKHKHKFVFENAYRKYDLWKCKCGKQVKYPLLRPMTEGERDIAKELDNFFMKKINPKIAKGSCCGIEDEPKPCHADIKNCPVCKHWDKEIQEKEKRLFEMIYKWGRVGVVTDEKCFAFKNRLREIRQLWWEREHHRVR